VPNPYSSRIFGCFLHIKSGIFAISSSYSSFSIVGKKILNLLTKINHISLRSNFQIVNHFGCSRYIVFAMYLDSGCTTMCLENPKQLTIWNGGNLLIGNCSLFSSFSFIIFTLRQILFCRNMLLTVADLKFQSGVDPHAFGNVLMPVMYQQMFQV
jgi:hypothetical protein